MNGEPSNCIEVHATEWLLVAYRLGLPKRQWRTGKFPRPPETGPELAERMRKWGEIQIKRWEAAERREAQQRGGDPR